MFTNFINKMYFAGRIRSFASKTCTKKSLHPSILLLEYPYHSEISKKIAEVQKRLKADEKFSFSALTNLSEENPHIYGQKPLSWIRQGLSLLTNPEILRTPDLLKYYATDIVERVNYLNTRVKGGIGSYSESQGLMVVRETVAKFIAERDQVGESDPNQIFILCGAIHGIEIGLLFCISGPNDGILIPAPVHPLYNNLITAYHGHTIGFFLESRNGQWQVSIEEMQKSYNDSMKKGITPKALLINNPGNTTGHVFSLENLQKIIEFCNKNRLVVIADESYQDNIYAQKKFFSFRKVIKEMNSDTELFSMHSLSKGFAGECGLRGGYVEILNIDQDVQGQLLKFASMSLASSTVGQLALDLLLNPPKENSPSHHLFVSEKTEILNSFKRKSALLYKSLNEMEGITCNSIESGFYAFPRLTLSKKAQNEAEKMGIQPDQFYAFKALEETGIVLIPGSDLGQCPGTHHFSISLFGSESNFSEMLSSLKAFNEKFHKDYKDSP